jgi:D-glycero-beta-D-manno-heptose-7-phosphate kinase
MTTPEHLHNLFQEFEKKNILIIGDVMIDSYLWGKVDRISPEAPVPIVSLKKRENRMGGAANVALNIQNMGANPILCSVIGKDDKSHLFFELMQKQQLDISGIVTSSTRMTTTKFRIIGNNMQMLRVDEETEKDLTIEESELLFKKISIFLEGHKTDAVVFEDYDKGVITPWLIQEVVKLADRLNIPVVVDPKKKNFLNYQGVTLFKPNLKELKEGLKLDDELDSYEQVGDAVRRLQEKLNVKTVLTTLSEKGIYYSQKNGLDNYLTGSIPAHIRNISDVSGAGDTVISIIALCIACKTSVELMASLANLAGGIVCEYVGVMPIDKNKLLSEAIKTIT